MLSPGKKMCVWNSLAPPYFPLNPAFFNKSNILRCNSDWLPTILPWDILFPEARLANTFILLVKRHMLTELILETTIKSEMCRLRVLIFSFLFYLGFIGEKFHLT